MEVGTHVQICCLVGGTGPQEEDLSLLGRRGRIVSRARDVDGFAPCYAVQLDEFPDYPPLAFVAGELVEVRE